MIGREKESKLLRDLYDGGRAELVAVYGRRRVGKTYLVDETFADKITFHHAGLSPVEGRGGGSLKAQLNHFYLSLQLHGMKKSKKPVNWLEAFFLLEKHLQDIDDGRRQLVFLDELPWLDTPRSGFITAFEAFWNTWGCHRKNLMVIICGSANSWVLDKLINNHGGLYNRVTRVIKLRPFTLRECEDYLISQGIRYSRYDIVQSYMILGGIPYYMSYFRRELSLAQNIDEFFFSEDAIFRNEYDRLFSSIFHNPSAIKEIIEFLNTRSTGYTRSDISKKTGTKDGTVLSERLNALVASDFVVKYVPFGAKKNQVQYKLTDPFCLFFLHFVKDAPLQNRAFWQQGATAQPITVWRGFAFENVCFSHIPQIKNALGISGVVTSESAWSMKEDDGTGAQIDLLITRNDNIVDICEMKFHCKEFTVTKGYYHKLLRRQELVLKHVSPTMAARNVLITTIGLSRNEYAGIFSHVVTLEDLFALSR